MKIPKNLRKYLLIIGLILMGLSFIFMRYDPYLVYINSNIRQENVSFESRDGLTITGIFYYPSDYNSSKKYPAIISVHGIGSRAEAHTRLNVEFCRRGFIVLGINLRGHGGSEGKCTLSKNEPYDIMGAIDYLYNRTQVNKSSIGVIGHSLGGMSSIRAAYNDSRINSTVVIAPPASLDILFSYYVENLDISEIESALGLDFDLTDPRDLYYRSPIYWVNQTNPKNLLIQVGDGDIIAQDDIIILRNATNNSTAEVNKLYGNFSEGTARKYKIYYRNPDIQHEEEPRIPEIIIDAIYWMENSLLGNTQGELQESDLLQWYELPFGGTIFSIGLILSFLPLVSYINSLFYKKNDPSFEHLKMSNKNLTRKNKLITLSIYALAYFGSSIFILPIIDILNISLWAPYNVTGALMIILSIRAIFLLIFLVPIIIIEKNLFDINLLNGKIFAKNPLRSTIAGLIIGLYFVIFYFYIPKIPAVNFQPLYYPAFFIVMILNLIATFYVDEIYNRALIQPKFNISPREKRISKYIKILKLTLYIGLLGAISFASILIMMWDTYLLVGGLKISFTLIGFIAGFAIFIIAGFVNTWIYLKTGNIISGSITQSLVFVWFTATMLVPL
ncbi:MAG: alpha/beta fold hydrolase [Candidatus Lokiarchaeota archaeon]|nr:alpha/beta fold hydrolase [Candidatus Lokiarchaeota archaeon]